MGAPAWTTRIVAGVTAALVIGVGAALALPVITGDGTPTVSVNEVPDTSHAALVKEYEQKVEARKADMEAAKERQAKLQKDAQEARADEDKAAKEDTTSTETKETSGTKDSETSKESTEPKEKESTDAKEKESTEPGDKDTPATPEWWPEHVWAHATSCTVAEESVVGTWDVWIKYGGDWTFVSASDDPDEVSGTDGDKVKIVYADRTATLHKQHDGMVKYRGGPVHVTVASAADSSETHTFQVDLWVVAKDDGTCPA